MSVLEVRADPAGPSVRCLCPTEHGFDAYFGGFAGQITQERISRLLQKYQINERALPGAVKPVQVIGSSCPSRLCRWESTPLTRAAMSYPSAVIDLNLPVKRERRRLRAGAYVAVAVAVLAAVAAAVVVSRDDGSGSPIADAGPLPTGAAAGPIIRFEAETESGEAARIQWSVGGGQPGTSQSKEIFGDALVIPWSAEVPVKDLSGMATLAVLSTDADVVTCRIVVGGEIVAESSGTRVTGCMTDLSGTST